LEAIERDEDPSKVDFGYVGEIIENNPSRANLYLRMKDKESRTAWLLRMINKAKKEE
jgi:hypothetical protein